LCIAVILPLHHIRRSGRRVAALSAGAAGDRGHKGNSLGFLAVKEKHKFGSPGQLPIYAATLGRLGIFFAVE
jgi:hypothetical protein